MRIFSVCTLLMLSFSVPVLSSAQGPFNHDNTSTQSGADFNKDGDPDPNNGGGNNTPTNAPIDGGIGALLAAGAIYGVKKYRARKANGNANDTNPVA